MVTRSDDATKRRSVSDILQQLLTKNSCGSLSVASVSASMEDVFPEITSVLVWFRFLLAILLGIYIGVYSTVHATSKSFRPAGTVLLQCVNVLAFIPYFYCKWYLGLGTSNNDTDSMKLLTTGLFNAIALCVLLWVYSYTWVHDVEEQAISSSLFREEDVSADSTDEDIAAAAAAASQHYADHVDMESEF